MKSVQQSKKNYQVPQIDDVNFIEKTNGYIKGYAVNTFHGLVKNYNQDRVSIIMNITKPNSKGRWPKCSYFAVFDGHGGNACSDFLKDNMHKYITENQYFPHKPIEALKQGFKNAQIQFLRIAETKNPIERSGSCAIVLLVIDNICYVANVGDSRAILSTKSGQKIYSISRDHKPDSPTQRTRILQAGGNIYQSCIKKNGNIIYGPHRIDPGKLSVSRSFGDIQAKKPQFGGNPNVLISKPEITYFTIDPIEHDFIMMGSDGIFDKMQNQEIAQQFWTLRNQSVSSSKIYDIKSDKLSFIGKAASKVITKAMKNMSLDNLTTLFIIFDCQQRLLSRNYALKDQNINQMSNLQNSIKIQRSKSSAQQKNNKPDDQNTFVSKFSLKRQISKNNLSQQNSKIAPLISQNPVGNNSREDSKKNPQASQLSKRSELQKSSIENKLEQQNVQYYANRQQSHSQHLKDEFSSFKSKDDVSSFKSNQMRSIESKLIQNRNIQNGQGSMGSLVRKKSHGLLRKDSKKESVWGAIHRGLKNNQKAIQKIRY